MVFSASFVFWYFNNDVNLDKKQTIKKEILISLKTSLLSTPCGILCFTVLYHPLHDFHNVPTQVIMMFLIALYVMLSFFTHKFRQISDRPLSIIIYLVAYYVVFLSLVLWGNPENEISTGPHEEIGPCNITMSSFDTVSVKYYIEIGTKIILLKHTIQIIVNNN